MNSIDALEQLCLSLPGTTRDVKWGGDLVFSVCDKMYVCAGLGDAALEDGFSVKVGEADFDALTQVRGISPAPHLARHHWVRVDDVHALPAEEVADLVRGSYALVLAKLPKKVQKALSSR